MTPGQPSPLGPHDAAAISSGAVRPAGGGISVQTLIVASVASAVASFTVSRIWGPGTLFSAAATPILVALVSELVRRPVGQVGATAQKVAAPLVYRPPHRSTSPPPPGPTGAPPSATPPPPGDPTAVRPAYPPAPAPEAGQPWQPPAPETQPWQAPPAPEAGQPWQSAAVADPVDADTGGGPRWRLILITGLLACLIVVGLFTALDVLAGQSITGNGDSTTYFGGSAKPAKTPTTPTAPTFGASGPTGTSGPTAVTAGPTGPTGSTTTTPATAAPLAGATGASGGTTGPTGPTGATGTTSPPGTSPSTQPGGP